MGSYVPSTRSEQNEMLAAIGCSSFADLYRSVPKQVRPDKPLNLPEGKSELEVKRIMEGIAAENTIFKTVFRGAGSYRHYIPAAVKSIVSREEFLTAYTPYQAEISQGILQSIFEYQTMICELTGMDVSNASVYDGATAAAESLAMCRERGRAKALVSAAVNPQVMETMKTYCMGAGADLCVVPAKDGVTDPGAFSAMLDGKTACFYMQQPNFYGMIEDAGALGKLAHDSGAKFIMGCNPIALAVLKTPAECGADIAVGEGQPLGLPMGFGGPYLGFMACREKMMRRLPGRIVGETMDGGGNRAFVLTLQAREQHIRREKASSNICSNEALCAMTASAYLAVMGAKGLREVAGQCISKSSYAAGLISSIPGYPLKYEGPFFNEFVTGCPVSVEKLMEKLQSEGILGGYPLGGELSGCILWCVTEMNTKQEIDHLSEILRKAAAK